MLDNPYVMINDLTSQLEQPADLKEFVSSIKLKTIRKLLPIRELTDVIGLVENTISTIGDELQSVENEIIEIENKLKTNQESSERSKRNHDDAKQRCDVLLSRLPDEVSADASSTSIDLSALQARAQDWLSNNNSKIEADSIWRSIRGDWLNDLEEPKKSTLEDLETMYTQMVNVEGVTTSFAGKGAWYRQHLKSPFDIVIIDEISKATPPESFFLRWKPCCFSRACWSSSNPHVSLPS